MRVLELLPAPAQTPAGWRHLGERRGVDGPVRGAKWQRSRAFAHYSARLNALRKIHYE